MKRRQGHSEKIEGRLRKLLLFIMIPIALIIGAVLIIIFSYTNNYSKMLQNVAVASEFNLDFKYNLDLKMYYYVVGSSYYGDSLPFKDVENAREVAQRLVGTTTIKENQRRVRSILNLCGNLEKYMNRIEETPGYDARLEILERDIYSITDLMTEIIYEYIYVEAENMVATQAQLDSYVRTAIVMIAALAAVLFALLTVVSLRFSKKITMPIAALCTNVDRIAGGDFEISNVETEIEEIQVLDKGLTNMSRHIVELMQQVRDEQISLRSAELKLLQSQINPHFLYNTLDTIVWLAEAERKEQVIHIVEALTSFFRTSLSNGLDIIPLSTEIVHVQSYLEIQKTRYNDILEYEIDVDPAAMDCRIPKLTLQPLVENALYHGIKNRRGKGKIRISGGREGANVHIRVEDDGAGMTSERLKELRRALVTGEKIGFGVQNVNERLKMYCGREFGLKIDSAHNAGACIHVIIPYKNELDVESQV